MEIRTSAHKHPCHGGVYHTYKSSLWIQEKECGSFIFGGLGGFRSGRTMAMEISIDDEHQKKGYSRLLVKALCVFIRETEPNSKGQLLFIDTDASGGFWEYIGMTDNPYYDHYTTDQEGGGYEKVITFEKLCQF
jgi:hypothetical protein